MEEGEMRIWGGVTQNAYWHTKEYYEKILGLHIAPTALWGYRCRACKTALVQYSV